MHDTAVGTANFTGCVPAPTDEGSRSRATERRRTRGPTHGMQRRPTVDGARLPRLSEPVSARPTPNHRLSGWAAV